MPESTIVSKKNAAPLAKKTEELVYYDVDYDNPYAIAFLAAKTPTQEAAPPALPDDWEEEGGTVNGDFLEVKKPATSALPDDWEEEGGVVNGDFLEVKKPATSALPDDWEEEGGVVNGDFLEVKKPAPTAEKPKQEDDDDEDEEEAVVEDETGEVAEVVAEEGDDDDEFADAELDSASIRKIATKVSEEFTKLSEFPGFKTWANGKLPQQFRGIGNLWASDPITWPKEKCVKAAKSLKEAILPIRIIGNSVLRNEYSENLGKVLAELCNTLTRFYNLTTNKSEGERPSLQGESSGGETPKFVSLDETGKQFEQPSGEDWQSIDNIFIPSIDSEIDSLNKTYDDINARIEKLKADDKTESENKQKSTALSFDSTEANTDIVNELAHHGLVSKGDWKYDTLNIFLRLGDLQHLIANTEKFVSEASKDLFSGQIGEVLNNKGLVTEEGQLENPLAIFKNAKSIFRERKTNVKAMKEQKDWFRTLSSILKNAKSELAKYEKDDGVINLQKIIANSGNNFKPNADEVAPFIGRMDGIVTPILRYIIVACNQGGMDKFKDYKEFKTYDVYKDKLPVLTNYSLGDLTKQFIEYIHDPASAGIDASEFEDKTTMDQTELYAYYKQKEKRLAAQKASKEHKRKELINLLMMTKSLKDTETLAIEKELIKNKTSATGNFDKTNATDSDVWGDGNRDMTDSMPEEEKQGSDLEEANSNYRTALRLVGIIAIRNHLPTYKYDRGTKALNLMEKLKHGSLNQRESNIKSVFKFIEDFTSEGNIKQLENAPANIETELLKALKTYAKGREKPPSFDAVADKYVEGLIAGSSYYLKGDSEKDFISQFSKLRPKSHTEQQQQHR